MADIADLANEHIEREDAARRLQAAKPSLQPTGLCYYCESPVQPALLFCDLDCRNDYDKEQRIRKISGSSQ